MNLKNIKESAKERIQILRGKNIEISHAIEILILKEIEIAYKAGIQNCKE